MPRSSKNRVALMEESGQTDAERRRLRQAQRNLQKKIIDNGEAMENASSEKFGEIRGKNNELFAKVAYTREAVLDGDNLEMIATHASRQVDALVQVPRYDALRFSQKLRQQCTAKHGSNTFFDWATLGRETGTCFNALPSRVQFLAGPLEADFVPKERKPRAKRPKLSQEEEDDEEEERPEDVKNQETNADQLSAVERNIAIVAKTLRNKSRADLKKRIDEIALLPEEEQEAARIQAKKIAGETCAIQYMMNPKSFTQSVENMFHFSFLVKKGNAKFIIRNGKPKVAMNPEKNADQKPPAKQSVVAFTMRDWRRLCKAYKVKQSDIPHRTGSKQKRHQKRARQTQDEEEE